MNIIESILEYDWHIFSQLHKGERLGFELSAKKDETK